QRTAESAGAAVGRQDLSGNNELQPTVTLNVEPVSHKTALAEASFLPGPVLLLGAPGVGKGTQAQLLVSRYAIPQISTGDLLRANIARGTELGLKAKEIISSGHLVDDNLVNSMVLNRLQEPDTTRGYILDGYPRTLDQAQFLDRTLTDLNLPPQLPVVAINIVVPYEELKRRITGRRICNLCKSIYNIYTNPPKAGSLCDLEGAPLVQRPDDTEEVFVQRMKTFDRQTAPVIEHYRAFGRFEEVDGNQPVESVLAAIESTLLKLREAGK
ncbi:MAG TPA: adenylate kinase, partial [Acidobacteriaceae bacterium]|nr:adenylate kinase [Acidobacteriaceae bacterium]